MRTPRVPSGRPRRRLLTRRAPLTSAATLLVVAAPLLLVGCSRGETSRAAGGDSSAAAGGAPAGTSGPVRATAVRGRLASVSDTALTVTTATGDVRVALSPPIAVYERVSADLSKVKESDFVGVTSVAGPGGTQRATEIHVFPEKLRGTNEGSFLMQPTGGGGSGGGGRSTMTNGTVASAPGAAGNGGAAPRMTNGTVGTRGGEAMTVQYRGGSQTITVPADVPVTAIAATRAPLTVGESVVVLVAATRPDGTPVSSVVLRAGGPASTK